ncbi:MAG: hypothetical protein IBX50_04175 [Marinospirillum sp.]|uniref:hypothetical protein n=1 Tax=Marinospirillum sp. TaxID=2183934 RepID=UPI001A0065E3|nr:hypothetical protein [Marinospirillum sp.]MBE0505903.1 hypothetical protein [Marinospirillum sp.]
MFALKSDGVAVCLQDYRDIKAGAQVPKINELWGQVEEWLDNNGGEWADMPGRTSDDVKQLKTKAKTAIDVAAGEARASFVSAGQLVEEEYRLAHRAAAAWIEAGRNSSSVPKEIQDWADASGMTASEAADDIIETASGWDMVLRSIRGIRLAGKAAINSMPDDADFDTEAEIYIQQIKAV